MTGYDGLQEIVGELFFLTSCNPPPQSPLRTNIHTQTQTDIRTQIHMLYLPLPWITLTQPRV